jgi:hypothetical protein
MLYNDKQCKLLSLTLPIYFILNKFKKMCVQKPLNKSIYKCVQSAAHKTQLT